MRSLVGALLLGVVLVSGNVFASGWSADVIHEFTGKVTSSHGNGDGPEVGSTCIFRLKKDSKDRVWAYVMAWASDGGQAGGGVIVESDDEGYRSGSDSISTTGGGGLGFSIAFTMTDRISWDLDDKKASFSEWKGLFGVSPVPQYWYTCEW
jgi:hypothetical protein